VPGAMRDACYRIPGTNGSHSAIKTNCYQQCIPLARPERAVHNTRTLAPEIVTTLVAHTQIAQSAGDGLMKDLKDKRHFEW
jgi:hypothetical protein